MRSMVVVVVMMMMMMMTSLQAMMMTRIVMRIFTVFLNGFVSSSPDPEKWEDFFSRGKVGGLNSNITLSEVVVVVMVRGHP